MYVISENRAVCASDIEIFIQGFHGNQVVHKERTSITNCNHFKAICSMVFIPRNYFVCVCLIEVIISPWWVLIGCLHHCLLKKIIFYPSGFQFRFKKMCSFLVQKEIGCCGALTEWPWLHIFNTWQHVGAHGVCWCVCGRGCVDVSSWYETCDSWSVTGVLVPL